jgi:uncharacterized protein
MQARNGEVAFELRFCRDKSRRAIVRVTAKGVLCLPCQRCLERMDWPVDESSVLALVEGLDEAAGLPEDYDPLLLSESLLHPLALVEDEVLLAIPAIPRHPSCDVLGVGSSSGAGDVPGGGTKAPGKAPGKTPGLNARANPRGQDSISASAADDRAEARTASPFRVLADWEGARAKNR